LPLCPRLTRSILIMSAAALLVVGFANAADFGFDTAISYAFLVVGGVLAVATVVHSVTTTRNAIFPRVRRSSQHR